MIAILNIDACEAEPLHRLFIDGGARAVLAASSQDVSNAERIVIPHLRAVRRTLAAIRDAGLIRPLLTAADAGCPIFAVGSGMHLLFDVIRDESQQTGLGIVQGSVGPFDFGSHPAARHFTSPHTGWNQVFWRNDCPLLGNLTSGEYFYFDHACHGAPMDASMVAATCNHGLEFPAIVRRGNVYGVQFLPDRSDAAGATVTSNFARLAA